MIKFFQNRGIGFWLAFVAAVVTIAAAAVYPFANNAKTGLIAVSYVLLAVGVGATVASFFTDFYGVLAMLPAGAYMGAFISALFDNTTAFALQFNGVAQGEGEMGAPNTAFWLCLALLVLASALAAASCFFRREKVQTGGSESTAK